MEVVRYQSRPELHRPVLICAFHGWNDASEAATLAVEYLKESWQARPFASIDPEEFFDFQAHRPQIGLSEQGLRRIEWPQASFAHAPLKGSDRDAIFLSGPEPSMRWRTYCRGILAVAQDAGVELVITLGALLAARPHTRPIRVSGTSSDPELARSLGLSASRYEGPTGIVGVLNEECRGAEIPAVSLWAWVPHYLQATPSPKAQLALLRNLRPLLELEVDTGPLEDEVAGYEERVAEAVRQDPDILGDVEEMERQADEEALEELPSGDELAAEVERYLKDQSPGEEH